MLLESFLLVVYILLRVEKIWLGTDNNLRGKVFFSTIISLCNIVCNNSRAKDTLPGASADVK